MDASCSRRALQAARRLGFVESLQKASFEGLFLLVICFPAVLVPRVVDEVNRNKCRPELHAVCSCSASVCLGLIQSKALYLIMNVQVLEFTYFDFTYLK